MKKNIKTYVDIEEIPTRNRKFYKVSFITTYDITFLGKYIKTKSKTEEVPFVFQTLDIAKDFCEINPKIEHRYIVNSEYNERNVYYETYKLTINNKSYYIKWSKNSIKIEDSQHFSFNLNENYYPTVDSFVAWIYLKSWKDTFDLDQVHYDKEYIKLSELVSDCGGLNQHNNKHWKFELVKNEEAKS